MNPIGDLNNMFGRMSGFFESDKVKGKSEEWEAKVDEAQAEKIEEMGKNTVKKLERETALDGLKKSAQLQVDF